MKLRAILIMLAVLAVAGVTYYFVSRPKPTTEPTPKYYVWNFDMVNLQDVTLSLPKSGLSESFEKHADDREFYFVNGPMVDNQRWGGGIPLLLSGPGADRLIYQSAPADKLKEYGFSTPNLIAKLTLDDGTVYEAQVGDSNPEGTTYYVKLTENNDVYTVDKSWYDVLAGIITNPPYVPATLKLDIPTVSPAIVAAGEPVTVSVNVSNNGDVGSSFSINLLINTQVEGSQTKTITLAARSSQVVTFTITENTAGKYVVSINQQHNVTFTVQ